MKKNALPPTIVALGLVSFLTDLSSEMIYPLLPLFVAVELGGGAAALGLIEGLAEATAALLKAFSGIWTDRIGKRLPFLFAGYGLAGLVRPLMALATAWPVVAAIRLADRIGKGLRSAPRDALIAQVALPGQLGRSFGFHRAMDHGGAVFGPLLAAYLLTQPGWHMRDVFALAVIPAVGVMLVLFLRVKEPPARPAIDPAPQTSPFNLRQAWAEMTPAYRKLMLACAVFALANSADAFLLLRLNQVGYDATWLAVLWSMHHVVKMTANFHLGFLTDRLGPRYALALGWAFYAAIYLAFALAKTQSALVLTFLAYGFYFGLAEPAERALVAALSPSEQRGSAFGLYHALVGLMALPASLLFGVIWSSLGAPAAFLASAGLAAGALALLFWSED